MGQKDGGEVKITFGDAVEICERVELPSTKGMSSSEQIAGACQMLSDLERLAEDGCIAAAWSLEWMTAVIASTQDH